MTPRRCGDNSAVFRRGIRASYLSLRCDMAQIAMHWGTFLFVLIAKNCVPMMKHGGTAFYEEKKGSKCGGWLVLEQPSVGVGRLEC